MHHATDRITHTTAFVTPVMSSIRLVSTEKETKERKEGKKNKMKEEIKRKI